jgi:hypothetical protein
MMNEEQSRWTIAIVVAIGGLFGFYTTLMVSYFTDSLPQGFSPLLLLSRITPLYFLILAALELCWFLRWRCLDV